MERHARGGRREAGAFMRRARSLLLPTVTVVAVASMPPALAARSEPSNDAFERAARITVGSLTEQSTIGATTQSGEPGCFRVGWGPQPTGATVWFRFHGGKGGLVTLDTSGSDFDTVLTVYSGTEIDQLTQVACSNDIKPSDDPPIRASEVTFHAARNETYFVQVGGYDGPSEPETGNLRLSLQPGKPPANDNFTDAEILGRVGNPSVEDERWTLGATLEDGEPACEERQRDVVDALVSELNPLDRSGSSRPEGYPIAGSVWFRYHEDGIGGPVFVQTVYSSYDNMIAVYEDRDGTLAGLRPVVCCVMDDAGERNPMTYGARFDALPDVTYAIQISRSTDESAVADSLGRLNTTFNQGHWIGYL